MAEKNAYANLSAFFGQSIQADQTITNTYREAVRNGITEGWTDRIDLQNTIKTSVLVDTLLGAEIKEVWYDTRNVMYYAAAVMEKPRTARLYNDMIRANQDVISNLINMNQSEKNSLEGFARYQFAATVADINITYENVVKLVGGAAPGGLKPGNEYRFEAQNITKTIPVGIRVRNDKAGRIEGAFAKSLSDLGFRSGGTNSRYMLVADITTSPVDLPQNPNKFSRIEVDAKLTDNGITLLPYNINRREGHLTLAEAENRAYNAAERTITEEYKTTLNNYLSGMIPKR
jgi:hypothetical protein